MLSSGTKYMDQTHPVGSPVMAADAALPERSENGGALSSNFKQSCQLLVIKEPDVGS